MSPKQLIALQRSAGNAAAAQWVRSLAPQRPMLQRGYLDQPDKTQSVKGALQKVLIDVRSLDGVLAAVEAYEKLPASTPDALEAALNALISICWDAKGAMGNGSNPAAKVLADLEAEASAAHLAVVKANGYEYAIQNPAFAGNSQLIGEARRDIKAMRAQYGTKTGRSTQQALFNFIVSVDDKLTKAEYARVAELGGATAYKYGDPETGEVAAETQAYLDAFDAIKEFLALKDAVLRHLQPLAAPVNNAPDKLAALKKELRRKEAEAGFGVPKVPLGILPGDVFVGLLRTGTVLDDFGAGLQHGELSHRIQWYAIIDFMQGEGNKDQRLAKHTPLDLFKKINEAPYSPDRQGNTMWGSVLDAGTKADAPTYSAPGTLNRDLLEASGVKPTGVGLAERGAAYKAPDTKGLESIGLALQQLRELRMKQAEELGGIDDPKWKGYGVPAPALADKIEKSMSQGGGYEVSDKGVSDEGKEWKVLQEVAS